MPISAARASASSGSALPSTRSARPSERLERLRVSGRNTSTRARERSAAFSSNDGFSVVAPISVTAPSSITGRKESCWARLKRWISSTNSRVPCPCGAAGAGGLEDLLELGHAGVDRRDLHEASERIAPISRATVVLPLPGGPQKIIEPRVGAASSRVSAPSGPVRCSWPETSARRRAASAARRAAPAAARPWGSSSNRLTGPVSRGPSAPSRANQRRDSPDQGSRDAARRATPLEPTFRPSRLQLATSGLQ